MKKNLYYRSVFRRDNVLQAFFLSFFYLLSSYPRLLLEVFIRKNFGERYFRLSSALTVALLIGLWPLVRTMGVSHIPGMGKETLMPGYLTWYIFLAAFVGFSIKHHLDKRRNPSVFDFAKFSLYTGKIHPLFYKIEIPGLKTSVRRIECLFEPALFFLSGLLLSLIGQNLGHLLIVCSLFYGFGYAAAYLVGDNFVMDKIDEMICNEELEKSFVDDVGEDETRGFRFRGRKPDSRDMRQQLLPLFHEREEVLEAT
jgi:hypothetical protein